jgi:hypothetical protein
MTEEITAPTWTLDQGPTFGAVDWCKCTAC